MLAHVFSPRSQLPRVAFGSNFGKTLDQIVAGLFANGEVGTWFDPSDINLTWRRNLLTYTEQFDNAAWAITAGSVSANSTVAPDGNTTADLFIPNTTSATHYASQTITTISGSVYTISVYLKAGGYNFAVLYAGGVNTGRYFNLATGTVGNQFVSAPTTSTITSVGNGWYRCSISFTATALTSIRVYPAETQTATFAGDGTSGTYFFGAQLEPGDTATDYQRIVTPEISYLDVQPLPILYQDAAGTTPVTAVEQPVSLLLDKSKGLVIGSERVTNGDFSNGATGWTVGANISITGGQSVWTATINNALQQPNSIEQNKWYKVEFEVTAYTSGNVRFGFIGGTVFLDSTVAAIGKRTAYLFSGNNTGFYLIANVSSGFVGSIDNISVKEIAGNHAYTPSTASTSRPTLSARYNLVLNSGLAGAATGTPGTAPTSWAFVVSGGTTDSVSVSDGAGGFRITYSATAARQYISQSVAIAANQVLSCSVTIFANTGLTFSQIITQTTPTGGATTGTFANGVSVATSYVPVAGDVITLQVTNGSTAGNASFRIGVGSNNNATGTLTFGKIDVRSPTDGVGLPAYQRVTTSTDYDTVNFPPYLRFDGSDDYMLTNSIDFTGTDKMTVFAGVRKLSESNTYAIYEFSADTNANNGTFSSFWDNTAPGYWRFSSKGTIRSNADANDSGILTRVLTGIGNISGDTSTIRINGTQAATSSTDQGTGNYGNYPLYIGRRGGATLPFNGRLYGLITRGAETNSSALEAAERFMNQRTGAY